MGGLAVWFLVNEIPKVFSLGNLITIQNHQKTPPIKNSRTQKLVAVLHSLIGWLFL